MASVKGAIVILAVLFCSSPARSNNAEILSNVIKTGNYELVIGTNHISETAGVYALCQSSPDKSSVKCRLNYHSDMLDSTRRPHHCDFNLSVKKRNAQLDILEVKLWGKNRAIFSYQERAEDGTRHSQVTIKAIQFPRCQAAKQSLKVYNRDDGTPELFILPAEDTYDIAFMDRNRCGTEFCKYTVFDDNTITMTIRWFSNHGVVHAMESVGSHGRKLVVTIGQTLENMGVAEFYLVTEAEPDMLGTCEHVAYLGWSTVNEKLTFCTYEACIQYNQKGEITKQIELKLPHNPLEYVTLYNLPNGKFLALICDDQENGNYRIVRIGVDGHEEYTFGVQELKCWQRPTYMTAQFNRKSHTEYCMSLFHSEYDSKEAKFSTYCFTI